MRWSDRNEDNLETLLRDDGSTKLGAALTELREHKTAPSQALRERVRGVATSEPAAKQGRLSRFTAYRPRFAPAAALGAAVLLVAIAIPIATMNGDRVSSESADNAGAGGETVAPTFAAPSQNNESLPELGKSPAPPSAPPPPPMPLAPSGMKPTSIF